jgi:hypothetical protein
MQIATLSAPKEADHCNGMQSFHELSAVQKQSGLKFQRIKSIKESQAAERSSIALTVLLRNLTLFNFLLAAIRVH